LKSGFGLVSIENLRKVVTLVRDHRPRQIVNTLRYAVHAARGFPNVVVPYDPTWLVLLISGRCNLACRHCALHAPERPAREVGDMPLELFIELLDRFRGTASLSLGGGEPLLHPRLSEMLEIAADRRLKVHIPTNGTSLSGTVNHLLTTPVEMLNVSLYGLDRESFARQTGGRPELFDATLDAVAELIRRRRPGGFPRLVRLSMIVTQDTLHLALPFVRLAEKLGVDQAKLDNICLFRTIPYDEKDGLYDDDPGVRQALADLEELRFKIPVHLPRLFRRSAGARDCTMPFRLLTVDGQGAIAPCCVRRTDRRWGTVWDEPETWNGPVFVAARRRALDRGRPMPVLCHSCEDNIAHRPRVGRSG
jgi:MoaA/NifB/PqqE/SkfB family radical SAM enzyme